MKRALIRFKLPARTTIGPGYSDHLLFVVIHTESSEIGCQQYSDE